MIVCSSCEVAPATSAKAGAACATCGERLIVVDTDDDLLGKTIDGRFEVLAPLGKGGMGIVYRAKQLSIGREIAVKVLDRAIEKDVKAIQRFFREAKLASALQHPNTVPIIDFGQNADGRLFLAMELINGTTLLEALNKQGAFQVARVIAVGTQLCDALEAAHDLQIVHRDLKLENVMLVSGKRDHVKVLDFGLARSLVDPTTAMTATGLVSGTPRYMAPEVALEGAQPAASQDMYALGVMLAEMSIGRPLWSAPTMELLFIKKRECESAIADVPAALKPLVRSLLSDNAGQRPTAGQARQLLRDADSSGAPVKLEPEAIGSEPTTELIPVEVSTSGIADPFAALDHAGVVSLDERHTTATDMEPAPGVGPPPFVDQEHDPRFSGPSEGEVAPEQLEIDQAYVVQRSAKLAARQAEPSVPLGPTRRQQETRTNRWLNLKVVLLLVAIAAGVAGYYYWFHVRKPDKGFKIYGPNGTIEGSERR